MLQPKRVKYRKTHKGHRRGKAHAGNTVVFGDFGLQALEAAWVTARQIEAARRSITHHIRRGGNIWIRIFPDKPVAVYGLSGKMLIPSVLRGCARYLIFPGSVIMIG